MITFDIADKGPLAEKFAKNIKESNLQTNAKLAFEELVKEALADESGTQTALRVKKSQNEQEATFGLKTAELLQETAAKSNIEKFARKLLPKEIIYGLSSDDRRRKLSTLHEASATICDPSFALSADIEELLIVLFSLNLNEFEGAPQSERENPIECHKKSLSALFVYNPLLYVKYFYKHD